MTICDDLRQSVLQAAIQGKLTKQLPEDGTTGDLLASIKAEKEQLIKEKKIKKETPLAPISEDEIPFDIPITWCWTKLQSICYAISAGGDKPKAFSKEKSTKYNVPVIANGITNNGILGYTDKASAKENTITVSGRGTIGYPFYRNEPYCPIVRLIVIEQAVDIEPQYLCIALRALLEGGIGTSIQQLTVPMISQKVIPLPPLAEQHRIVARVNELMAKIDELETVEKELVALKKAFPGDMKASLLQAAMQGKLTQQLPEDGSAADLLASIKAEKEQLIKEKKIKKEKPLAPISEDEIPFDIPDNWACVKAGYIFSLWDGPKVNAVRLPNLDAKFLRGKTEANILTSGKFVHAGDKMILVDGENSGEVFTAPEDGIQGSTFKLLYISRSINTAYALYFLLFYKDYLRNNKKGSAIPHLNKEMLANLAFPIPPLAEQKRIVEKLDKLLPLCDALKEDGAA